MSMIYSGSRYGSFFTKFSIVVHPLCRNPRPMIYSVLEFVLRTIPLKYRNGNCPQSTTAVLRPCM